MVNSQTLWLVKPKLMLSVIVALVLDDEVLCFLTGFCISG